jgi:MinD-like ATPase involved in chromosome partitioning or flagellar assembly
MRAALLRKYSIDLVREAARAGAGEIILAPIRSEDTQREIVAAERASAERYPGGVICSVFSTIPGAGVTTISAGLAVALQSKFRKSVVVVGLDLQKNDLAMVLDARGDAALADLCDDRKEFSVHELLRTLRRHRSGVHVLAASRRIELNGSIQPSALASILRVLRQLFDFVIVDCGSQINFLAEHAWRLSEFLFFVLDQSRGSARAAWRFLHSLTARGAVAPDPSLILNRFDGRSPVTEDSIRTSIAAWQFLDALEIARCTEGNGASAFGIRKDFRELEQCGRLLHRVIMKPFFAILDEERIWATRIVTPGPRSSRRGLSMRRSNGIDAMARKLAEDLTCNATHHYPLICTPSLRQRHAHFVWAGQQ